MKGILHGAYSTGNKKWIWIMCPVFMEVKLQSAFVPIVIGVKICTILWKRYSCYIHIYRNEFPTISKIIILVCLPGFNPSYHAIIISVPQNILHRIIRVKK